MPLTKPKFVQTSTNEIKYNDTVIVLNNADARKVSKDRPDQGILMLRPGTPTVPNVGVIWDEPAGQFAFVTTHNLDSVDGQISKAGYAPVNTGDLNISGNTSASGHMVISGDITATGAVNLVNAPVLSVYTGVIPMQAGTTIIPSDNTEPLKTEGTEFISVTVTPKSANSKFTLMFHTMCDTSSNGKNITMAIFRDDTCVHATAANMATAGRPNGLNINFTDEPATTDSITYSVRVGISSAATWYINNTKYSIGFSSKANSSYILLEHN